ncbi:hypothetical protein AA637_03355 [Cyanobacterium sp. HL-69]|uniref:hypothetical protein n=1 Tax=Cyanobacterium sp. HL-69 TaxID=2054282 RepID=UPI000CA3A03D|nr:hypothetical protein AA637_03355 [Cyanobacterium sp. HL-69]
MSKFFHHHSSEDEELVDFLKNYCPDNPLERSNHEQLLFRAIAQEGKSSHKKMFRWRWAIPTSLVTGLLIVWGASTTQQFSPQVAQETTELEAFMFEVWSYSSTSQNAEFNPDSDYVTFTNDY